MGGGPPGRSDRQVARRRRDAGRGRTRTLRAGIARGPVLLIEGDDHIGDAVNLASRLCRMAEPQQVLAPASLVSSLMVNTVERPIGDRDVDGFAEPLPVVELLSADRP